MTAALALTDLTYRYPGQAAPAVACAARRAWTRCCGSCSGHSVQALCCSRASCRDRSSLRLCQTTR